MHPDRDSPGSEITGEPTRIHLQFETAQNAWHDIIAGVARMIHNFSDHAANERTFLAWVRTALALMALGFLVTRFNLFLRIAAQGSFGGGTRGIAMPSSTFGDIAGLLLILAGTIMVAAAAVRFIRIGRAIDSPDQRVEGSRMDLALAALLLVLGIALALFLSHSLLTTR